MLANATVVAFVATADAERSKAFYETTLGLPLVADEPYVLVFCCGGTTLRVQKVEATQPPPFTVLGWQVADIQDAMAALADRGVTFERFPGLQQDARGIWTTPDRALVAWFKDPDGNVLSLTQVT